tara:strand:+ start:93 stop:521 length:429 start_codon:yes stop_codon:yes gene_type:complete
MAHMDKFMVFHSSGVDSSSVNSHDAGTDVDLGCFKVSDVTAVMAEEDFVYVYFKDATRFEGNWGHNNDAATYETMEQCYVRLGVAEGKEFDVVKDLTNAMTATGQGGYQSLVFDAVNSVWPISNLTSIQIRRQLTLHTIASD